MKRTVLFCLFSAALLIFACRHDSLHDCEKKCEDLSIEKLRFVTIEEIIPVDSHRVKLKFSDHEQCLTEHNIELYPGKEVTRIPIYKPKADGNGGYQAVLEGFSYEW